MRWLTLFSRSGSEILKLEKILNTRSIRITNKRDFEDSLIPKEECIVIDSLEDLYDIFEEGDLITLHGFLRILPPDLCKYNVYNGHPGLITKYPELKGKDPQERSVNYKTIGAVIHKVTPEVDDGEVIIQREVNNPGSIELIYSNLSELSLKNWVEFLEKEILNKQTYGN